MYNGKSILALIPARGGSKRLPHKNVKPLLGKPLIAWTIEAAKKSRYVDRIVVSTEDRKIKEVSALYGAETPFVRPAGLAKDDTPGSAVVKHAINWFEKKGQAYDYILLLQPTSPLRRAEDIDGAVRFINSKDADAVISVCESGYNPLCYNTLPPDGRLDRFLMKKKSGKGVCKPPILYRINGALYIGRWNCIKKGKNFFVKNSFAYIMPVQRSVDIDTGVDFKLAEVLIKAEGGNT